jgi:hypothetical protein
MPDLRVQGWVQELLLGSAYNTDKTKAAFSVDRTVLVYHTTIRQYKDGVKRIMLNTSPIGQTRPYYKVDRQDVELSVDTRSDRPKKDIQYEALTEADIACKNLLKKTKKKRKDPWVDLTVWMGDKTLKKMREGRGGIKVRQAEIDFFLASLKLLNALCLGRNVTTHKLVRKLIPVEEILVSLESHHLSIEVKTQYAHLLHNLYVDSAFLDPMPSSILQKTLLWQESTSEYVDEEDDVRLGELKKVLNLNTQEDAPEEETVKRQATSSFKIGLQRKRFQRKLREFSQSGQKAYNQRTRLRRLVMEFAQNMTNYSTAYEQATGSTSKQSGKIVQCEMHFTQSMLKVIRGLLRRGFFDEWYNMPPTFTNKKGLLQDFYSGCLLYPKLESESLQNNVNATFAEPVVLGDAAALADSGGGLRVEDMLKWRVNGVPNLYSAPNSNTMVFAFTHHGTKLLDPDGVGMSMTAGPVKIRLNRKDAPNINVVWVPELTREWGINFAGYFEVQSSDIGKQAIMSGMASSLGAGGASSVRSGGASVNNAEYEELLDDDDDDDDDDEEDDDFATDRNVNSVRRIYVPGDGTYDPLGSVIPKSDGNASICVDAAFARTQMAITTAQIVAVCEGADVEEIIKMQLECNKIVQDFFPSERMGYFNWMFDQVRDTMFYQRNVLPFPEFIMSREAVGQMKDRVSQLHTRAYLSSYLRGHPEPSIEFYQACAKMGRQIDQSTAAKISALQVAVKRKSTTRLKKQESGMFKVDLATTTFIRNPVFAVPISGVKDSRIKEVGQLAPVLTDALCQGLVGDAAEAALTSVVSIVGGGIKVVFHVDTKSGTRGPHSTDVEVETDLEDNGLQIGPPFEVAYVEGHLEEDGINYSGYMRITHAEDPEEGPGTGVVKKIMLVGERSYDPSGSSLPEFSNCGKGVRVCPLFCTFYHTVAVAMTFAILNGADFESLEAVREAYLAKVVRVFGKSRVVLLEWLFHQIEEACLEKGPITNYPEFLEDFIKDNDADTFEITPEGHAHTRFFLKQYLSEIPSPPKEFFEVINAVDNADDALLREMGGRYSKYGIRFQQCCIGFGVLHGDIVKQDSRQLGDEFVLFDLFGKILYESDPHRQLIDAKFVVKPTPDLGEEEFAYYNDLYMYNGVDELSNSLVRCKIHICNIMQVLAYPYCHLFCTGISVLTEHFALKYPY